MKRALASFLIVLGSVAGLSSCASSGEGVRGGTSAPNSDVPDQLSLRADRAALDEARKDIPEDKKRDNDELAFVLQMAAAKTDQEPTELRNRFDKAVRDRREKSDREFRRRRGDFDKTSRKSREAFLKKAKDDRDSYMKGKHDSDARKDFFDKQEDARRDYFSNESETRNDFDSKLNEDRKAFNDYIKEKTDRFNEDMRAYTEAFYDRKKNEKLANDQKEKQRERARVMSRDASQPMLRSGQSDELDEFNTIPQGPGIRLGTPSDDTQ